MAITSMTRGGGRSPPGGTLAGSLLVEIRAVYRAMRGAYGWPRVGRQLKAQGVRVGKRRVQRAMQQAGIRARGERRFRICNTDSRHTLPVAANLLDRNFTVHQANVAWVGDITYIPTRQGWLYLATVLDLISRRIVGWSTNAQKFLVTRILEHLDRASTNSALDNRLRSNVADAYTCVGNLEGNPYDQNIGDAAGGLISVTKAAHLTEHWKTLRPSDPEVLHAFAFAH